MKNTNKTFSYNQQDKKNLKDKKTITLSVLRSCIDSQKLNII